VFDFQAPLSGFSGLDEIGSSIKLVPQQVKLKVIPVSLNSENGTVRGSLVACSQPCAVLATRRRLQSVSFKVLNFPEFFGQQDAILEDGKGGGQRLGAAELSASPWHIELIAVPELKDAIRVMKAQGGYGITHTGQFTCTDGKAFSTKEAERLLEGLRLFLSFARGAFCSPVFQTGTGRDGKAIWRQWGSHVVAPWGHMPSWFDTMNGHLLSEVFPGFWQRLNDPVWKETIRAALYWYLRSNAHGQGAGVDGGLILAQAALERLSYAQLGRQRRPASRQIREALDAMRIPTNIPRGCRKLRKLAETHGWQDGPRALTEVRNQLVHPRSVYGSTLSGSYFEAWNLSQRYVELMLLRLFGHHGHHANRLAQKWRGQVVYVPWA